MKFFAVFLLLALVAAARAGVLPAEQPELKPESEAEPKAAEPRDKRGLLYGAYASPYAAAYSYPAYTAAYSYPYAYSAPVAYSAYSAYGYPSYYRSAYIVG